jgi:phosphatidylserine decarboxylase
MLFQKDVLQFNPAWQPAGPVQLGEEMAQLK